MRHRISSAFDGYVQGVTEAPTAYLVPTVVLYGFIDFYAGKAIAALLNTSFWSSWYLYPAIAAFDCACIILMPVNFMALADRLYELYRGFPRIKPIARINSPATPRH